MTHKTTENSVFGIPLSKWGTSEMVVKARLEYASYVSHAHKYVYVETPKVACTKMKMLIHRLEGLPAMEPVLTGPAQSKAYMYIHARKYFDMPSLVRLPENEAKEVLHDNSYYKFCFVRNPYSRLASVWRNKVRLVEPHYEAMYQRAHELYPEEFEGRFLSFSGFIRFLADKRNKEYSNPHWGLQASLLFPHAISYDFIGNIESLDTGIETIEAAIGASFKAGNNQHVMNASAPHDWRSYYNDNLADQVYMLYRKDFETFGYNKDSWQGGVPLPARSSEEVFLEEEIFERNRMIRLFADALRNQS